MGFACLFDSDLFFVSNKYCFKNILYKKQKKTEKKENVFPRHEYYQCVEYCLFVSFLSLKKET